MHTVDYLIDASKSIWESYYKHPFVKGIEDGSLCKEKFRYYILQDYLYLEEYAKTFAVGIAKSRHIDRAIMFSKSVNTLLENEMDIHRGYIDKLKISKSEIENSVRHINNISYTSYMLRIAYEYGEAEIITAILSCAYSYELIAKNMIKNNPECINDRFYGEWISSYSSEDYSKINRMFIDMLNQLTVDYGKEQIENLADIFKICSMYEYLFWDFSWQYNNI